MQVSGFAFAGYAAGIAAYLALHNLHISTTLAHVPFFSGSWIMVLRFWCFLAPQMAVYITKCGGSHDIGMTILWDHFN